jgi:hypothetical protein
MVDSLHPLRERAWCDIVTNLLHQNQISILKQFLIYDYFIYLSISFLLDSLHHYGNEHGAQARKVLDMERKEKEKEARRQQKESQTLAKAARPLKNYKRDKVLNGRRKQSPAEPLLALDLAHFPVIVVTGHSNEIGGIREGEREKVRHSQRQVTYF